MMGPVSRADGGYRRLPSPAVALIAVVLVVFLTGKAAVGADSPNVLFIVSDDLNCDLGCYGHSRVNSPHIDRLAARGVRFERAYCQYALCNPSRASFMTGLYPTQTRVHSNGPHFRKFIPNVTTLPQLFEEAGYITARVGKIYHYGVPRQIGTPGKDDAASWQERINPRGIDRNVHDKIHSLRPGRFGGTLSWLAIESEDTEHTDGIGATAAIHMLRRYAEDPRPFFLAVGFYRPHTPYVAPKRYFRQYPRDGLELARFPDDDWDDLPEPAVRSLTRKKAQLDLPAETQRTVKQAYYASVSLMDAQVGRLLNALARLELEEDTIVVFTSDHGYHLGEHGWWQKTTLFEESARVPLIVAGPGVPAAGRSTAALAELVDLYPTLAELAGLKSPGWLAGRSLVPALEDPEASVKQAALTQLRSDSFSIRTDRFRYTEWQGGKGGAELYDHRKDPGELHNLAGDESQRATVERLSRLLHEKLDAARQTPPDDLR